MQLKTDADSGVSIEAVTMSSRPAIRQGIGASLATAACTLLGALPTPVRAEQVHDWNVDAAVLSYNEDQGRVKDLSGRFAVSHDLDEDHQLNGSLTIDTLTGASPSGATPSDTPQTFTSPSGKGSYSVAPGSIPLDDTFHDSRLAVAGSYTFPLATAMRLQTGLDASNEHDYRHLGANVRWEHDFHQKNTTLFAGAAFGSDTVNPEGGIPVAFAAMAQPDAAQPRRTDSDSKTVIDALLGVSQILSRRAALDVSLAYGKASGYLTDPYKILSRVDAQGRPVSYLYENRPDSRTKTSLFAEYRYALDRDSFAVNYRFMNDDWGIHSHTVEARYHWNISRRASLEPQLRYYTQSAADFYHTLLPQGSALPQYASADYRLANLSSWTAGAKLGWLASNGWEYSLRVAYYSQKAKAESGSNIGILSSYELVPSLKATIAQFGIKFGF